MSDQRTRTLSAHPSLGCAILLCLWGCDGLGNPTRAGTQTTAWGEAGVTTTTRTRSFVGRAEIETRVRDGLQGLDHSDRQVKPGDVLTLVSVDATFATPAAAVTQFHTVFELSGGTQHARRWKARRRGRRGTYRAAFSLPSAPRSAVTEVVR